MTAIPRRLLAAATLALLAACASQTTVETKGVTDAGGADARRRAEVHTALAGEYYQRGNFNVALAESRLAIRDDSSYAPAYNVQGLVFMELRDDVGARQSFDRALSLQPNDPEVLNNFGWFLCTRNDTTRGLEMLKRASGDTLYPTPEKALLSTGLCMRRLHQDAEAEQYLRRALSIRPDLLGALYNLAAIAYERGDAKQAEGYLNRYMRLATPALEGLVLGVQVARANHDSPAEQSYLQQLRRRFPDAPEARALLDKAR